MTVKLLTEQQKQFIEGKNYKPDSQFNPIEDVNGNWVISLQESNQCTNIKYEWVKNLPEIEYEAKSEPELN